jgi:hypothetical protein
VTTEDRQRYLTAAHAMQSGVAAEMALNPTDTQPKHLRVGVNSAMVDGSAMATLLMSKGLITADEYEAAIADAMEAEVARYEKRLRDAYGLNARLG